MKTIATISAIVIFSFSTFAQIEKPKPVSTTSKPKPTTTSTSTPISKGVATIIVTWKGPGAAKIIIGTNEFFLSEGGSSTIKLDAGLNYSPTVILSRSDEHTTAFPIVPEKGKGTLELSFFSGSLYYDYLSEKERRDAAILDSLNNISIQKQKREAYVLDSINDVADEIKQKREAFVLDSIKDVADAIKRQNASTERAHNKIVTIGQQVWQAENLNYTTFRNGDIISEAKTDAEWKKAGIEGKPAWCYYDNNPSNETKYGKLYNWFAVNDPRGLAPIGWHVASNDDFNTLISNWKTFNNKAFAVIYGGKRFNGVCISEGEECDFWSSTAGDTDRAFYCYFIANRGINSNYPKSYGMSVRCIKD